MADVTIVDIKRAIELCGEYNLYPCQCEEMKDPEFTGVCEKHGIMKVGKKDFDLMKKVFGIEE